MHKTISAVEISSQESILLARQRARQIAALFELESGDQIRFAAAVSEVARDILSYAAGGNLEFAVHNSMLVFTAAARNENKLTALLNNANESVDTSGIIHARRLIDYFNVQNQDGQTRLVFGKRTTKKLSPSELRRLAEAKATSFPINPSTEIIELNRELVRTVEMLKARQEELARLNLELEETNRGVVALYAELDEKAEHLKMADSLKSRFLSHISHEFRTPLNSIIGLSRLLLDKVDGDLSAEQEKQIRFVLGAAEGLTEMVNDLLDIAKIEAGKTDVHPQTFQMSELFGALRGMFRPIAVNPAVTLHFNDAGNIPALYTDEAKVSQILRNYISNALKFTERGEVRVSAQHEGDMVKFSVSDTGIGIPQEQLHLLFQEFSQIGGVMQKRVKGTGLGLALCKKLAELLGGYVSVTSEIGEGSTFYATIPLRYAHAVDVPAIAVGDKRTRILIIDDDEVARYLIRTWLPSTEFELIEASDGRSGLQMANDHQPDLILLDLNMPDFSGFDVLNALSNDANVRDIPVVINTSKILETDEERFLQLHAAAILSKHNTSRQKGLATVKEVLARNKVDQR